jgi:hypothetical protein
MAPGFPIQGDKGMNGVIHLILAIVLFSGAATKTDSADFADTRRFRLHF